MADLDLDVVDRLLTTTRAVRKRLDLSRPVPREVILECLRLAIQAPSGSNAQLWRWLVIDDAPTRAAIADMYRNPPGTRDDREPRPPESAQQRRVMDSARYLREHLEQVPVFVIPCIEKKGGAAGWAPSIYPATWSFMLALRSRGLGTCITTVHLVREQEAAAMLGIPDGYAQACLLPVAYYTGESFRPAARRPVEELTYWNRWDER
jgi:nitroreductase